LSGVFPDYILLGAVKMKSFLAVMILLSTQASSARAEDEYFNCTANRRDTYIHVLGAVDRTTGNIRVGAETAQTESTPFYKRIQVDGAAKFEGSSITFQGTDTGHYASGYISLNEGQVSRFYAEEFESLPLTCSTIEKTQQHSACGGRWYSCSNLLGEPTCCYSTTH
jgi:hypothetical protein